MRWLKATLRWGLTALAAALLAAWPLSRWWILRVVFPGECQIYFLRGCLWLYVRNPGPGFHYPFQPGVYLSKNTNDRPWRVIWSFGLYGGGHGEHVAMPLWAVVPFAVAAAGLAWRGPLRTALRRRRGACLACGYPRLGLAPESPCPECGTVPAP